ncbi:MAG: helix-turn-helix domain-containing protein [Alphaproteobacteria bacterium]|nr:helix-turn-helix domain-containing protein [Alphaproteobacteria bacterium]
MLREWLKKGFKKPGKSQTGLAKVLGVDQSVVSKMASGVRKISAQELFKIARYLDEPIPASEDAQQRARNRIELGKSLGGPILNRGRVAAGVWREPATLNQEEPEPAPIPRDPRYPHIEQYALEVEGESVNKIAQNGWTVVCVSYWQARRDMVDGDLIHVERKNEADQREYTLKRLKMGPEGPELWPERTPTIKRRSRWPILTASPSKSLDW